MELSRLVYLACDDRSGSTLLERCLAAAPEVCSIGELHNLSAYVHQDRSFFSPPHDMDCTCGARVVDCPFWTAVEARLDTSLAALKLRCDFPRRSGIADLVDRVRWKLEDIGRRADGRLQRTTAWHWLLGYGQLQRNYWQVYDAVAAVSGKPVVVDSSKWPFRIGYIGRERREGLRIILMYRSPWAVVHSKMRHNDIDPAFGATKWLAYTRQMEAFAAQLPPESVIRVFYETFCTQPDEELARITRGIGGIAPIKLASPVAVSELHHIGGSPSQFDETRTEVVLDEGWRTRMEAPNQAVVTDIAGDAWSALVSQHGDGREELRGP